MFTKLKENWIKLGQHRVVAKKLAQNLWNREQNLEKRLHLYQSTRQRLSINSYVRKNKWLLEKKHLENWRKKTSHAFVLKFRSFSRTILEHKKNPGRSAPFKSIYKQDAQWLYKNFRHCMTEGSDRKYIIYWTTGSCTLDFSWLYLFYRQLSITRLMEETQPNNYGEKEFDPADHNALQVSAFCTFH